MTESQYKQDYEDAKAAIDAGDPTACDKLLTDTELPRYYRIKTLVLLASASKQWRQKEDLRLRAEHIWSESRTLHPTGQNTTTDSVLSELRDLLNTLKTSQASTAPSSSYEDELSTALAETEIEDLADIADGEMEELADEEYARDQCAPNVEAVIGTAHAKTAVTAEGDGEVAGGKVHSSSPNSSFAPASSLEASKEILGHVRDGQSAGASMVHRTRGVSRRSS
ncbi:hypothetical protein M438DRAFT_329755 [Aureobasidium pullulans EXF-150]|uniref:Uncharacterized protein n=1 Tax=Aureobasidium pullulans EXF-150 TaxID=1043002 RepID=A0A074X8W4_AURPU|nr:uncharacterized protein M438DRAFT_329755 [Aureobasidium pullulans EXF-150]KEQ78507.1 hypothetical protein M438DRAFT_329755 [Aureobasidium pullulans EXF-150]